MSSEPNRASMNQQIALSCQCGQVKGIAEGVDPGEGTRLLCYCRDCQAFARFLGRESELLDGAGGSDIYQLAPCKVRVTQGLDKIECVRLTGKGLYRWYTSCCKTPVANTVSGSVPFVGLLCAFVADPATLDRVLGPVKAQVYAKQASGPLPETTTPLQPAALYMLRIGGKLLRWKVTGAGNPSPFFNSEGEPLCAPRILATD